MKELPSHLLFYDGVCAMCNAIVKTMIRLDREGIFHYTPLQGETAALARRELEGFPDEMETVVYVREGEVYLRSRAAVRALRALPYPARALSWFGVLPVWLTDFLYGLVARWRYRVFGQYDECPLPPPEARARFLP